MGTLDTLRYTKLPLPTICAMPALGFGRSFPIPRDQQAITTAFGSGIRHFDMCGTLSQ